MKVKAAPGLKVPMEDNPANHITDAPEGVEIPHTHYYVRRMADGDLVEVTEEPGAPAVVAPPASAKKPAGR